MNATLAATERLLLAVVRNPLFLIMLVAGPIALVVIFGYIFGGAISLPDGGSGAEYREFLIPGLLVVIAFNIIPAMTSAATESARGISDRFRAMPISRAAVPTGQVIATTLYGTVGFAVMMACGLAVGWRIRGSAGDALLAVGLLLLFLFTMTWAGAYLGYLVADVETAGQTSILVLPATMLSNVFVPTDGMPGWMRVIAEWNPMSALSAAVRELFGNPTLPTTSAWPSQHPVAACLIWAAGLLLVLVPLCTRRYAQAGR